MREECGPEKWAHYVMLAEGVSPFGHRTSNIVECVNGAWLEHRANTPYNYFDTTQLWCFEKIAERYAEAVKMQQPGRQKDYAMGDVSHQRENQASYET